MKMSDAFSAKAIAVNHTETASNKIPYLGVGLFPPKKKTGLDLKWIKTPKAYLFLLSHPLLMQYQQSEVVRAFRSLKQKWHTSKNP